MQAFERHFGSQVYDRIAECLTAAIEVEATGSSKIDMASK